MYRKYADLKDKFEIVAVHNSEARDLKDYDRLTATIQKRYWGGKPLPFPLLLDDDSLTYDEFGVSVYPTFMLVDPEGKVVKEGGPDRLEAELGKLAGEKGEKKEDEPK